ncbi:alpha/beta fold hydrolase [Rhodococcus sp. 3Y1]
MISRTEGFITVADGEQVWYETAGEGPDLILTHGLGGNAAVWYQQVPYFAQHYRVISWDQRGFGRSTNENGNHGPVAAVSDLIEIMDLLAVDRAHVVGQSMGGWAALGTAIAVPDRVESVVLACTTGGIPVGSVRTAHLPHRSTRHRAAPGGASRCGRTVAELGHGEGIPVPSSRHLRSSPT